MSLTMCPTPNAHDFLSLRHVEMEAAVEELLACADENVPERRASTRYPLTRPVLLTPADPTGLPLGRSIFCMGKEISAMGFGFFHQEPLPHRYLLASFAPSVDYARQFLMRMKRCRFLSENWYESGAQFIRVVGPEA